jgi:hypothetical protein
MSVTDTSGSWGCPGIAAVVQVRFQNVSSSGYTLDAIRVYDGSGNGAAVSLVETALGLYQPNGITAGAWSWGSWNSSFNDRLSWSQPNIRITVTTPGESWLCSRGRTLVVRRA